MHHIIMYNICYILLNNIYRHMLYIIIISFIIIARSRYKHPALARDLVPRAVVNILAREIDLLPDGTVGRNVSFPYVCPKPVLVNIRIFSINSRQKGEKRFRTTGGDSNLFRRIPCRPTKNTTLFVSFPYVCPEPVLVNRSFLRTSM